MDETSTDPAIAAEEGATAAPTDGQRAGLARRAAALPWRNAARCLLLAAVVGAVGFFSFQPGLLRLSILLSLVSPSRGESLNWKAEEEPVLRPAPVKFTPQPDEFRLSPAHEDEWLAGRPGLPADAWRGGELHPAPWRRDSYNPWAWADDDARAKPRADGDGDNTPGQKAESSFRAAEARDWILPSPAASAASAAAGASALADAALERVPSLAPIPPLTPPPPLAPPAPDSAALRLPAPPPALPSALPSALQAERASEQTAGMLPERPAPGPIPLSDILPPTASLAQGLEPAPDLRPLPSLRPPESRSPQLPAVAPAAPAAPAETVDWKEREITEAIPGAYLTIYPKLKFIGLCVPGQGYIRKYNQVAVPADQTLPKESAADGRTPYGRFAVAAQVRDALGPRLELNWPGGGVSLTGDRARTEQTSGGFSLEAPHMEEIFTALADGAAVFIQE